MPRAARIVVPGCAHHVTQRGNHEEAVFLNDADRRAYLEFIREAAVRHQVSLLGYVLMSNHVHWVATPPKAEALAAVFGRAHFRYSSYFQVKRRTSGHLWQGRFFSEALTLDHLVRVLLYIERNPLRAGLVRVAEEYVWSSAQAHVTGCDSSGLLDMVTWGSLCRLDEWRDLLRAVQPRRGLQPNSARQG
jgi:putative transposase